MSALSKSLLLFLLNWLDAQLTILWVRGGHSTEGNGLMAYLPACTVPEDRGARPARWRHWLLAAFLPLVFIIPLVLWIASRVAALVAYTLYRFSHLALARRGLRLTLGLYLALMLVHAATGASALGWQPPETVAYVFHLPSKVYALLS